MEVDKTVRMCSSCEETKSVDEFYKDGKDPDGNAKYRRDCKECYRVSRLMSRHAKRGPVKKRK